MPYYASYRGYGATRNGGLHEGLIACLHEGDVSVRRAAQRGRSAIAGSTSVARRAGTYPASAATAPRITTIAPNVAGSVAPTSYSRPRIARAASHAAGRPTAT